MTIDRESKLARNYLARRQLSPIYPAKDAIRLAREEITRDPPKIRYPPGASHRYGGNWQSLDSMPRHASKRERAYYCDEWPAGWRLEGAADEVCRAIRHTGWYTEDDGDTGTLRGYVLRLPHGKLIPGYRHSDYDGVTLFPLDVYDDSQECARAADGYAEHAAEEERDYQRAWRAGSDAAEAKRDIASIRAEIISVCRDVRATRQSLAWDAAGRNILDIAKNRVCRLLADYRDKQESFWNLCHDKPSYDARLAAAWEDGFGQ